MSGAYTSRDEFTLENAEEEIADLRGQISLLTEILTQANGPVPVTPPAGSISLFANGGQFNYINASGLQMGLMGAQNAFFPGTTRTAATLGNVASATYLAGDAETGAVYELEVWGHGTQGSTLQTLQFGVAFAGQGMQNFVFGTTAFSATVSTAFRWHAIARVICLTTGTSGTWNSLILGTVAEFNGTALAPGNRNTAYGTSSDSVTTYTANTAINQNMALQAAWGSTTGAPTLTSDTAIFKRIA